MYGGSELLSLDRHSPVRSHVLAFNQRKCSERFEEFCTHSVITHGFFFLTITEKKWQWHCFKRNGPSFSCVSIELRRHSGNIREARKTFGFASCSPNFLNALVTQHTHAKNGPFLNETREHSLVTNLEQEVTLQCSNC